MSGTGVVMGLMVGVVIGLVILLMLLKPQPIVVRLARSSPSVLFFHKTTQPVIALTIDDGPHPIGTPLILDVLARHNVKATFFLIGNQIHGKEAIVRQIIARGHEIGNHSTRDFPSVALSNEQFEKDLWEAHAILSKFGERVRWFRPGWGLYTARMLTILERCQYQCALGSVFPYDPVIPVVGFSAAYILSNVRAGSVIILHDGPPGSRTARTLARTIPELHKRGYHFATLSGLPI